ncbi:hypothetical protein AABB24_012652, partial [Solanum stoloniferum]
LFPIKCLFLSINLSFPFLFHLDFSSLRKTLPLLSPFYLFSLLSPLFSSFSPCLKHDRWPLLNSDLCSSNSPNVLSLSSNSSDESLVSPSLSSKRNYLQQRRRVRSKSNRVLLELSLLRTCIVSGHGTKEHV